MPADDDDDPTTHRRRRAVAALVVVTLAVGGWVAWQAWPRGPARSVEAFCSQLGAVSAFDKALGGLDAAAVHDTIPKLQQLRQVAPPDIEAQVGVVVDVSQGLAGAVDQAAVDDGKALQDAWRARAGDLGRIEAAGRSLQDYARTRCNVELGPGDPDGSTTTSTAGGSTTISISPGMTVAPH